MAPKTPPVKKAGGTGRGGRHSSHVSRGGGGSADRNRRPDSVANYSQTYLNDPNRTGRSSSVEARPAQTGARTSSHEAEMNPTPLHPPSPKCTHGQGTKQFGGFGSGGDDVLVSGRLEGMDINENPGNKSPVVRSSQPAPAVSPSPPPAPGQGGAKLTHDESAGGVAGGSQNSVLEEDKLSVQQGQGAGGARVRRDEVAQADDTDTTQTPSTTSKMRPFQPARPKHTIKPKAKSHLPTEGKKTVWRRKEVVEEIRARVEKKSMQRDSVDWYEDDVDWESPPPSPEKLSLHTHDVADPTTRSKIKTTSAGLALADAPATLLSSTLGHCDGYSRHDPQREEAYWPRELKEGGGAVAGEGLGQGEGKRRSKTLRYKDGGQTEGMDEGAQDGDKDGDKEQEVGRVARFRGMRGRRLSLQQFMGSGFSPESEKGRKPGGKGQ
ncbi:unnamed protein product [Vitrella brassicaformis CCMP3155]|uniref:Uncharacterized protein n=1 Tax=Vitrella brassicaformis (strain CCMP3155) TaxID=1169540 RepID=A0A0G4E8H3_VITBC|nr:unnamed protein product [Vitrella brassicaformis CCMP3155]|eukprot:CEL91628.1 unnamed protein product [Vitrella brassicaformis CCMP3155]